MSPEAIRAPDEVDARSDLYALGAVGYFLLTGQHVFSGATMVEICSHHLHSEPIPPSERVDTPIPGALERVILSCLAKDKADRPASATALQEALRACDGVDDWSQHDARRWWDEHGGAIASRRRGGQPLTDASIAIDLARTMAASAP
jgi:serine/threonine-protein kinase